MTKIAEFANSVYPDEAAHNKPPHLDLHYLPSSLFNSKYGMAWTKPFLKRGGGLHKALFWTPT